MTNPTPHGQVPDALRLAEEITNLECSSEAAAKTIAAAADELCRLHVENASLRASPTPPALSAAPEAFLSRVIALCTSRGPSPENIEAWDKYDKWIADLWRQAEAMLAASPTPPAEQAAPKAAPGVDKSTKLQMTTEVLRRMQQQEDGHNKNPFRSLLDRLMRNEGGYSTIEIGQLKYALDGFYGAARAPADSVAAPAIGDELRDALVAVSAAIAERDDRAAQKMICEILAASTTPPAEQQAQPGAVYAELPDSVAWLAEYGGDVFTAAQLLNFADRTHALRMQAAPKAVPGELSADSLRHQNKLLAETLGACILASGIVRKDIDGFTGPELLHFGEDLRSMLEVAPQQEAQEPAFWMNDKGHTWNHSDWKQFPKHRAKYPIPLYPHFPAPQPAPAPLSDDAKRLDWLDRNIFSREMSDWDAKYGHGPDYNMWVIFSPKGAQGSARNIIDAAIAAQRDTP